MKAARKLQAKPRSRSSSSLSKVMKAVAGAGSSLGSMVKDNVMAAEKYLTGSKSKTKSAKSSRKQRRPQVITDA